MVAVGFSLGVFRVRGSSIGSEFDFILIFGVSDLVNFILVRHVRI